MRAGRTGCTILSLGRSMKHGGRSTVSVVPEVKAAMFHREIMAATQEYRKLHDEAPSIWMSQELYDLLFNDKYFGWHFSVSVADKTMKYFGCQTRVVELPGCQYLVGTGWEEPEEDPPPEKSEEEMEAERQRFLEIVKNWIDEQKKELKKEEES